MPTEVSWATKVCSQTSPGMIGSMEIMPTPSTSKGCMKMPWGCSVVASSSSSLTIRIVISSPPSTWIHGPGTWPL